MLIGLCFSYLNKGLDAFGMGGDMGDHMPRETESTIIHRMKIRDEMDTRREHVQENGVVTDEDKSVGRGKETMVLLGEFFRTGRIDKIGEPLFRSGILVEEGVFRFFDIVFRFFDPPVGLEKAVKKGKKGQGGGAWESAPFGTGERVHVDPFANRGEKEERKDVSSCADVDRFVHSR